MAFALPARSSDPAYASAILDAVTNGNYEMPFSYVNSTYKNHTGKFLMSTDCLKVDGVRWGAGAYLMQQVADAIGCMFPTPKLRDLLYLQRAVDLSPITMWGFRKPSDWPIVAERGHGFGLNDMTLTTTMRFISSKVDAAIVKTGRFGYGIVQTVGKPWVLTNDLLKAPGHAANYGWYYHGVCPPGQPCSNSPATPGLWMIQGPGTDWLRHDLQQADYAQTITLVHRDCVVDGSPRDLADIYRDPELAGLVSHEGPLKLLRQPGVPIFRCTPTSVGVCPAPTMPSNVVASAPLGIAWEPEGEIVRPSVGPLVLAAVGLVLTIGGFFGGLALMGTARPKYPSPRIYENPTIPPDFRALVDTAQAQGWTVSPTKGGHLKFQSPTGAVVFAASTPSDWRASRNLRTTLRRAGLAV